jgi:hypothetical protein
MKKIFTAALPAAASLVLLLSVSSGTGNATASKAKPFAPRTLVTETGMIHAFAQDAHSIAWIGTRYKVHVRSFLIGKSAVVGSAAPSIGTRWTPVLALGDTRALWTKFEGGNTAETSLWTAPLGGSATGIGVFFSYDPTPDGIFLSGVAGDGPTLVYGRTLERCVPGYPTCRELDVDGGGVSFVTGQYEHPPITGVPAPVMIAFAAHDPASARLSQGLLAVAPAASPLYTDLDNAPRVAKDGPVQVYRFYRQVALVSSVSPRGFVRAIALSFRQLSVLVERPDGSKELERYNPRNGALLSTTPVPKAIASELGVSSAGTVYRVGTKIYRLAGGAPQLVWKASGTPIGLSIEGKRIAWAVNLRGHGRVMALDLR